MSSRYLSRIDADLREVSLGEAAGVLLTRKAAYLARMGDFRAAASLLNEIRGRDDLYAIPVVATWVTFVDGVVAFYQDLHDQARDRWNRSRILGSAIDAVDVVASSCAWLAHIAFGRFNIAEFRENMITAAASVRAADHDCLARLYLVVAVACHLAGARNRAVEWYVKSRREALVKGDDATVSSIIYNQAAMDIAYYRWSEMISARDMYTHSTYVPEAESAENFDKLVGVISLEDFTPLLKAQAYSLAGRFDDAARIYRSALQQEPTPTQRRHRGWLLADWAYCCSRLGDADLALNLAAKATGYLDHSVQCDDLAAAHTRLELVFARAGNQELRENHASQAALKWSEFAAVQHELLDVCDSLVFRFGD